jgi:hypothetical protein
MYNQIYNKFITLKDKYSIDVDIKIIRESIPIIEDYTNIGILYPYKIPENKRKKSDDSQTNSCPLLFSTKDVSDITKDVCIIKDCPIAKCKSLKNIKLLSNGCESEKNASEDSKEKGISVLLKNSPSLTASLPPSVSKIKLNLRKITSDTSLDKLSLNKKLSLEKKLIIPFKESKEDVHEKLIVKNIKLNYHLAPEINLMGAYNDEKGKYLLFILKDNTCTEKSSSPNTKRMINDQQEYKMYICVSPCLSLRKVKISNIEHIMTPEGYIVDINSGQLTYKGRFDGKSIVSLNNQDLEDLKSQINDLYSL